jgi:hypothetical protein
MKNHISSAICFLIFIFTTIILVAHGQERGVIISNSSEASLHTKTHSLIDDVAESYLSDWHDKSISKIDLPITDSTKKSTSSVFAILNTTGRTLLETVVTDPNCGKQKGNSYIVVRVLISPSGDIINALAGINDGNTKTKNASQCLIDWAKSAALTLKFSETKSEQNQSGIIIFDIREK